MKLSMNGGEGTKRQIKQQICSKDGEGTSTTTIVNSQSNTEKKRKKMDLRQIENVMKSSEDVGVVKKKENLVSNINTHEHNQQVDSGSALQLFLDHIPVSAIPGIKNSPGLLVWCLCYCIGLRFGVRPYALYLSLFLKNSRKKKEVLELKSGDSVRDAIHLLYEKNVSAAPIADTVTGSFSERYIGFIEFASIVLWCLEEWEKVENRSTDNGSDEEFGNFGVFDMLEQYPQIGQTKIGELAKSFLWDPYFPVSVDDTLFHALLLLSKHQLQVVPVIERTNSQVIGFISQRGVIHLLLQSNGLGWFDSIADKRLSDFRFSTEEHVVQVYGDQSIAEAIHVLWKNRSGAVAVTDRKNKRLLGSIRNSDIYLLLENDNLFQNINSLTVEKFIHMGTDNKTTGSDPTIEPDLAALLSAGFLRLKNSFLPPMDSPLTNKKSHTLKQAMRSMADTKSSFSFLVDDDESQQPTGVLTLRDMIIHFAPPCMDSSFHGGGFFESALEQTGCHVQNGTIVSDN